ncbi:MAG TPA: hypothetical protein VFK11_02290, partial [Candidatus Saccharimonadales bacterium]|nr:hypothetical protein [Candidatus Saccharimonadales bacterium]
ANLTFQKLEMINPMAQVVQDARYTTVTHQSATVYQVFGGGYYKYIPFAIVVAVFIGGVLYFKKEARFFAENI